MDVIDNAEEEYFLQSPLLKILLIEGKKESVNKIFSSRPVNGEYHRLFQDLLEQPNKFAEYFRMTPNTFYYILDAVEENITKYSNFRECISAKERLVLTLR